MEVPLWQVDAFSGRPFGGNPAAVCLVRSGQLSADLMQKIAAENNLSETAFVILDGVEASGGIVRALRCVAPLAAATPRSPLRCAPLRRSPHSASLNLTTNPPSHPPPNQAGDGRKDGTDPLQPFRARDTFALRWFTPAAEVPLCGHATLAAAHVLLSELGNAAPAVHFDTLSGRLTVARRAAAADADGSDGAAAKKQLLLEMDMPAAPPLDPLPPPLREGAAAREALIKACTGSLGAARVAFAASVDYAVMLLPQTATRADLEAVRPDFAAMRAAADASELHGVIVAVEGRRSPNYAGALGGDGAGGEGGDGSSSSGGGEGAYDFYSRFFAPWLGIDEDPVTGSAHCVLAPLFAAQTTSGSAGAAGGGASSSGGGGGGGPVEMVGRQCSARGGDVYMRMEGCGATRVRVAGEAVTTIRGTLLLPAPPRGE